jgi:hypothetical protein
MEDNHAEIRVLPDCMFRSLLALLVEKVEMTGPGPSINTGN